jgi:predicted dehydrogenase
MDMERLKVGVIGTGHLGQVHARIYDQMDEFELIGVVDTSRDTARRVANEYSCTSGVDPSALIGDVDAISIAVPTTSHYAVALPYLNAGIPVLLEKPIAATVPQAEELVAVADKNKTPLLIGHLERFNPALLELRARLQEPEYIEVHRTGPFVERAADVDVVTDLMIHDLDILASLLGELPEAILAVGNTIVSTQTDFANVRLEYPGGVVASMTASRVSQHRRRLMRVYEANGYFELDYDSQELVAAVRSDTTQGQNYPHLEYTSLTSGKAQPLEVELAHFYQVVRNGEAPVVPGQDGLAALRLVEKINSIISEGGT